MERVASSFQQARPRSLRKGQDEKEEEEDARLAVGLLARLYSAQLVCVEVSKVCYEPMALFLSRRPIQSNRSGGCSSEPSLSLELTKPSQEENFSPPNGTVSQSASFGRGFFA